MSIESNNVFQALCMQPVKKPLMKS